MRIADEKYGYDYIGKSTDTKPTTGVWCGATFYEVDTKKFYVFYSEDDTWYEM